MLYPFVKPQAMFLGAVEVRGSHEKFGPDRPTTSPAPGRRCADRVRARTTASRDQPRDPRRRRARGDRSGARSAVGPRGGRGGHGARPGQAGHGALAGGGEAGGRPVVRGLRARAVPRRRAGRHRGASGRTSGMPRTTPPRCAGGRRRCPAARVHLVVCPPPGAEPDLLWRRFADACGITAAAAGVVDPVAVAPANLSLTTEAIATLRSLNARLAGRITPREHARFVKRRAGGGPAGGATRYAAPHSRVARRRARSRGRRLAEIDRGGRRTPCTGTSTTSRPSSAARATRTRTTYRAGCRTRSRWPPWPPKCSVRWRPGA